MKNAAQNELNIKRHSAKWQNETCLSSTKRCTHPPSQVSSGSQSQVRAVDSPQPATQPYLIPQILRTVQPCFSCHVRRQDWSEINQLRVRELGAGSTLPLILFTVLFKTFPHFVPKRWLIWALWGELGDFCPVSSQTMLAQKGKSITAFLEGFSGEGLWVS